MNMPAPEWLGLLVVVAFALVWYFEILPPLGATLVLRVRGGRLTVARGHPRACVVADVAEILAEQPVTRGFIAVNGDGRTVFSRSIPASIRQQLRNVITNG